VKVVTVFPENGDANQHHALTLIFMEACTVCLLSALSGKNSSCQTNSNFYVCTVHQQYQSTFFINPTDAHNYKITGMLIVLTFL